MGRNWQRRRQRDRDRGETRGGGTEEMEIKELT